MKKKILIALAIVLLVVVGIYIIFFIKKESKQNEKITLFGKELNSLEDISDEDIKNYLVYPMLIFKQRSYNNFTNDDITVLIAYKYLVLYGDTYKNIGEVQDFVKSFFGVNNFEIKEGRYISPAFNNEEIIISKEGDRFVSNLMGKGDTRGNRYISKEVKKNQVIVHYNYGYDDLTKLEQVVLGKTDVYLNYIDGNLILEKIVYTKNDSEQKDKIHLFGKEFNTLSDVSNEDIKDYTKEIAKIFVEKTYNEFSYSDIVSLVAYKLLVANSSTNEEIVNYVETILGTTDFQLKEGVYKTPNGKSEIVISKDNNGFTSNLKVTGPIMGTKINVYKTFEVADNYVIVHYDYGYDDLDQETFVVVGKSDIYLKYANDNLILEKIVYEKK